MQTERSEPSKKTIRSKLRKKRKQLAKAILVVPNVQLSQIIGEEPRTRSEVVNDVWRYIEQKDLEVEGQVETDAKLSRISFGKEVIRKEDVSRFVILNVSPVKIETVEVEIRYIGQGECAPVSESNLVCEPEAPAYGGGLHGEGPPKSGAAAYSSGLPGNSSTPIDDPEEEEAEA